MLNHSLRLITFSLLAGAILFSLSVISGTGTAFDNSQAEVTLTAGQWREDIDFLARQMESLHPDLFFSMSRGEFESIATNLKDQVGTLTRNQIVAELIRLMARVSQEGMDGHTSLIPLQEILNFHLFPLWLYLFEDGIYVIGASPEFEDLVGAEVLSIDGQEISELMAALDPYVSRDNEWTVKSRIAAMMLFSELLHAIGLTESERSAQFEFRFSSGDSEFRMLDGISLNTHIQSVFGGVFAALPEMDSPLYLTQRDERFWLELLPDIDTLYVRFSGPRSTTQSGESITEFSDRIAQLASESSPEKIVVDLRHSQGGDNTTYGPLLEVLSSAPVNQCGKLFVVIGREVFSASSNFATDMRRLLNATFIGEPTGGSPNHFGDGVLIQLPNSQITVQISTIYHQSGESNDPRLTVSPDIFIPVNSQDFFAGIDPVMTYLETLETESLPCFGTDSTN